jgi:hypothetical protein
LETDGRHTYPHHRSPPTTTTTNSMLDASLQEARRQQQQLERDLEAQRQQQQQQDGGTGGLRARIERSEQRGVGSYRYYEHIEIRSGPYYYAPPPAYSSLPAHAAAPLPLAALAVAVAVVWAAVTAAFARNYALTTFADAAKARLLLTWPYLLAFSKKFRAQFVSALRGRPYKAAERLDSAGSGGGGGGGGNSGGSSSS